MSGTIWLELLFFFGLLAISTPLLGNYMAKVYGNGKAPGDRFFLPIERFTHKVCRIDPESEQRWRAYVMSMLVYTLVGGLLTYRVLRLQQHLPGNPDGYGGVSSGVSFNTAISFMTNTNWQNYAGESTMSQFSQMFGLVWHQFISAAAGMALAAAFIRALVRHRRNTLGNFWVETIRSCTRVLIPISFASAIVLMSQGVIQNFSAQTAVTTVAAQATHSSNAALIRHLPGRPVASMAVIEALGDNGGGYFNANFAHPLLNPNGVTNILLIWLLCMIPFAFAWTFGKMVGSMRQGAVVLTAMSILFIISILIVVPLENRGNPYLSTSGVSQSITATSPGGNLEGKDLRRIGAGDQGVRR
jgi:potassium-transporting ATPase potassium-binding subunit